MRFALLALVLAAPQAPFPLAPVNVTVSGKSAIRVRIWAGSVMPCDSGTAKLLDAKVSPGYSATLWTDAQSVCVQHTEASFPDVGWTPPRLVFRKQICLRWVGWGKFARCDEWAVVPINIDLAG